MDQESIISQTKSWISTFVIAYNLCPFAALPFQQDRIKYRVVENQNLKKLVDTVLEECLKLSTTKPESVETTLIIHPNLLQNFYDYLETIDLLQEGLEEHELEGIIQLATFHPDYQFGGTEFGDPENFTNRSPFPMIHLLRENSVEKAINLHPDTNQIPDNNIRMMNKIGAAELIKQRNEIIRKN